MKYALSFAVLLLAMTLQQPAFAQGSSNNLVKEAVTAQGGADALRGLKTVAIKGDAKFWEPGQSFAPDGEPRFLGDATFAITWDLAKGQARTAWDRDQKYPDPIKLKLCHGRQGQPADVAYTRGHATPGARAFVALAARQGHG